MESKTCSKCGHTKPLDSFYQNGRFLRPECKECSNKGAKPKTPEQQAVYNARWLEKLRKDPERYAKRLAHIRKHYDPVRSKADKLRYREALVSDPDRLAAHAARRAEYGQRPEVKASRAKALRKWTYGLSDEEYTSMLDTQHGKCAICKKEPIGRIDKTRKLHVDHCHTTGKVRGLLCLHCNRGLGGFLDSVPSLQTAIKYLERHEHGAHE